MRFILSAVVCCALAYGIVALCGCTKSEAQSVMNTVQEDIKAGAAVAAQITPVAAQVAETVAPGSTAAKDLAKANVTVTKVNGIVQKVTITIPDATPAVPTP